MDYCSDCGAKVRNDSRFCPSCGVEFDYEDIKVELFLEDVKLKINESFSEEDNKILEKVKKKHFEKLPLLNLKLRAEEIAKETEIKELISYKLIKKNLEYNLPHQQEGALKILRHLDGRALLADEVGLGKTITAGMVLKECIVRGFVKKALILTPASLVDQWIAELKDKFNLDFNIIEHISDWEDTDLAIASIDKVKNFNKETNEFKHDEAHKIYWDILIIDEAHKLKNRNTTRWKFVDKIQKKRFLMLTATPFQNDLIELYNLLYLLRRGHLGTISEFKNEFLDHGDARKPINTLELKKKLNEVMIRRRRDETKVNYKKRLPKINIVRLSKEELDIYRDIQDLIANNYLNWQGEEINTILAMYTILPKITSSSRSAAESLQNIVDEQKYHESTRNLAEKILNNINKLKQDSKIDILLHIVDKIVNKDKDAKMIIYTKHPSTRKYIASKLKRFKIVEFGGGLTRTEKTAKVTEFENKAKIMISTDTGAEGLNFQFCNNIINYDLPWNPMTVEQRIGRLDRIGQTKNINIYSLATKDTMEEHVVDLIINKMCCIGLIIGELPIILFNMGLDANNDGKNKVEDDLYRALINSKNNLVQFGTEVEKIGNKIEKGVKEYEKTKEHSSKLIDKK